MILIQVESCFKIVSVIFFLFFKLSFVDTVYWVSLYIIVIPDGGLNSSLFKLNQPKQFLRHFIKKEV